jgi:hypothetical protein
MAQIAYLATACGLHDGGHERRYNANETLTVLLIFAQREGVL